MEVPCGRAQPQSCDRGRPQMTWGFQPPCYRVPESWLRAQELGPQSQYVVRWWKGNMTKCNNETVAGRSGGGGTG